MLRYTALLHTSIHPVDLAAIKQAVETILLRAYSPVTFRFGSMAEIRHGLVLVEIATDARKEYLCQLLKGLENKYPLEVEEIGWGWMLTKPAPATGDDQIRTGMDTDPFRGQTAQSEPKVVYQPGQGQRIRLVIALACGSILALITLTLLASYFFEDTLGALIRPVTELLYFLWFPFWIIFGLLLGLSRSFFIWRYPSLISCDATGICVEYLLGLTANNLNWSDIQTMEIGYNNCKIRSATQSLQFQFLSDYGRNDLPGLVPTIAERASLHFVGAVHGAFLYKRFTAP